MKEILSQWMDRYFGSEEAVLLSLLLLAAVLVVFTLGGSLAPIFAALIFAYLLQGAVNWLQRVGVPKNIAISLTYLVFVLLFFAFIIGIVPLVGQQTSRLVGELPNMIGKLRAVVEALPERYSEYITPEQHQMIWSRINQEIGRMAENVLAFSLSSFPGIAALLVYLILVPLLVFFMLKDKDELVGFFSRLLPEKRPVIMAIWHEMDLQISNYVRGKAIEILIVGGVSYLSFVLLGLNYAALLALLVGLSVLIPYIGAMVVTLPVLLVGYFQWGFGSEFFWLFGVYGVIQFLDGNLLVPLLFSEVVNLHPVAIIVAVLLFGGIWGFWGVFFAIPLATLVKAVYNAWPSQRDADPPAEPDFPGEPESTAESELPTDA